MKFKLTRRRLAIYVASVFIALLGITAIYFICASLMLSDIVALHYSKNVLNVTDVSMEKAVYQVAWQGMFTFAWLLFVYFVTALYGLNRLDGWLEKRWENAKKIQKVGRAFKR